MTVKLNEDIAEIVTRQGRPVEVTDTAGKVFVVMTGEQFRSYIYDCGDFQACDAYPLVEEAFAEGWNAPGMEVYDEPEDGHQTDA